MHNVGLVKSYMLFFLSQGLQSRLYNSNLDPEEIKRAKEGQVSVYYM